MSATAGEEAIYEDFVSQLLAGNVAVALISKVESDLQKLRDRTGLSRTDIINRAITLYEFIDEQLSAGNQVHIKDPRTGEVLQVNLS